MKTIALFVNTYLRQSESFIYNQLTSISKFHVEVLTRDIRNLHIYPWRHINSLDKGNYLQRLFERIKFTFMLDMSSLRKVIRNKRIIMVHAHFGIDGVYASTLCKKMNIPLIVTFHGYDITLLPRFTIYPISWLMYWLKFRELRNYGALFLAVSDYVRGKLIESGFPAARTITHYLGVDTDFECKYGRNSIEVLFAARLVKKKGAIDLIDAIKIVSKSIPAVKLIICGDGPLKSELMHYVEKNKLEEVVHFNGWLSKSDLYRKMETSAVFVVPSITTRDGDCEGLPTVLLEAMSRGIPVIGTQHSGIPDAIKDGENGYVVPEGNVSMLAERISLLLKNPAISERCAIAARKTVEEKFDIKKQVAKLETIYESIIREKVATKIAVIVRHTHKKGGISRYVAEMLTHYPKEYVIHIFTASYDLPPQSNVIIHKVPIISFSILKYFKYFALNNIFEKFSFMIISFLMVSVNKYDIIHNQGDYVGVADVFTAHSCHKAWLSEFRRKEPNIVECIKKSVLNPLHLILLFIERKSIANAKHIIAISKDTQRELTSYYQVPENKVSVIPNGVNVDEFRPRDTIDGMNCIRERYAISSDEKVIIFPAHEFHRKGLAQLIRAMSGITTHKVRVLVVGRDDPRPFLELAENLGCSDQVIFAGHTSSISDYYNASDMLVFPTVYEPFGLIVTEAMASGLPVIVSRCAGAAELITEGVDGLLINNPGDVDEIRSHIIHLCADTGLCVEMGKAARLTALKYSWAKIANMTVNVYNCALKA